MRAPWWGADLQTISNYLRPRARAHASPERLTLALTDGTGDRLSAALDRPPAPREGRPLAVLLHGLSGDEVSAYVVRTTAALLPQGYTVLRLNLRGAGPSRPMSRLQYHAGRTADLAMALEALPPEVTANGIVAVGYSLGGNMLLKFLGERGTASPVCAAVSVSAPIDLAATSERMLQWRNAPYQAYLMREIRVEALAPISEVTATERRAGPGRAYHPRLRRAFQRAPQRLCGRRRLLCEKFGAVFSGRHKGADPGHPCAQRSVGPGLALSRA